MEVASIVRQGERLLQEDLRAVEVRLGDQEQSRMEEAFGSHGRVPIRCLS
jgi:hypothetical protein